MEKILSYLQNANIYFITISDYMIIFGFNESYICGSISFYNPEPLCRFNYFNGLKKYFKNFIFNEKTFSEEYTKAKSGYIYIKNKEIESILNVLD